MTAARLEGLIDELRLKVPEERRRDAVIFGSAAIVLHGVDLGRPVNDLDLFISEESYVNLEVYASGTKTPAPGVVGLVLGTDIEAFKTFPGVTHADVLGRAMALPQSRGMLVAALGDLALWKRTQGRLKDLEDLRRIEVFQHERGGGHGS